MKMDSENIYAKTIADMYTKAIHSKDVGENMLLHILNMVSEEDSDCTCNPKKVKDPLYSEDLVDDYFPQ